jgi:nitrous oxidase accessory protein NosD
MRLVHRSLAVGIAAAGILAATSGSALGATIDVFDGGSIQAAVRSAHRGDVIVVHPGVYRQSVSIKKDGLTLRGAGPSKSGSVIRPGKNHRCGHGGSGICVVEHKPHGGGDKVPTAGTRISGFLVRGFKDSGFIALNARRTVIRHNKFLGDGEYGAAAFVSRRTRFINNLAKNAGEAGFYVGDSPHAKAFLKGNTARHNGAFGYFLRDSAHGLAVHNRATRNCLGFGLIDTGAPGGARKWALRNNRAIKNNNSCPAGEEGPPVSGLGIGLSGARHTRVRGNVVRGNRPAGASAFSGGILLVSGTSDGGSNEAHVTLARNRAHRNQPLDIAWDGKGQGIKFRHNACGSSQPGGICH